MALIFKSCLMKKFKLLMALVFTLSVCNAQTDSVKTAIDAVIHRRVNSADSITAEKLNGVLTMINNKATTINNKVIGFVGSFDSSRIYRYNGNYGVTPNLNPPQISYFAASNLGEFYLWNGNTWSFIGSYLTQGTQTINGDKNFTGKIAVNGVSSNGTATMAAITTKGVVSQRDTTVNTDFTLDGNYGMVGVDCTNGSHSLTMPNESNTRNWVFQLRKEDNTTNPLILKRSDGTILYTISSKFSLSFKNKNSLWVRIY